MLFAATPVAGQANASPVAPSEQQSNLAVVPSAHFRIKVLQRPVEIRPWAPRQVRSIWDAQSIYISENGCAAADVIAADGKIYDTDRVMFLRGWEECLKPVDEGRVGRTFPVAR
jgi:beta-glucosidase/6-phospho-beta-glucosidase/beta-galactosidase